MGSGKGSEGMRYSDLGHGTVHEAQCSTSYESGALKDRGISLSLAKKREEVAKFLDGHELVQVVGHDGRG